MELRYGKPEEAGMSEDRLYKAGQTANRWVSENVASAVVLLAARKGIIAYHEAFGKAGPEPEAPDASVDTIFPMCSISKPVTATCIMMLVEEGLIDLFHSVSKYIPEFTGEGKNEVAIHHLLTHTSGMNDGPIEEHVKKKSELVEIPPHDENQDPSIHKWLFLGYDAPLWKKPGEEMSYSSYGYEVLGELVRRVSGKSLDQFSRERIFKPLGMKDTNFIVPEELWPRVIRRKPSDGEQIDWFSSPDSLKRPSGAGGLYSTARDLAIFGQMFLNKGKYNGVRLLSPATIDQMTQDQIPNVSASYGNEYFPEAVWGYGWNIRKNKKDVEGSLRSPRAFTHGGFGGVQLAVDPEYDLVAVYLSAEMNYNDIRGKGINILIAAIDD